MRERNGRRVNCLRGRAYRDPSPALRFPPFQPSSCLFRIREQGGGCSSSGVLGGRLCLRKHPQKLRGKVSPNKEEVARLVESMALASVGEKHPEKLRGKVEHLGKRKDGAREGGRGCILSQARTRS